MSISLKPILNDMWKLDDEHKEKCLTMIKKICGNIQRDPNNPKFKDLNFSKVRKAFTGAGPGMAFLFAAGFTQSVDGSRLQFKEHSSWAMLQGAMEALDKKENPPPPKVQPEPTRAVDNDASMADAAPTTDNANENVSAIGGGGGDNTETSAAAAAAPGDADANANANAGGDDGGNENGGDDANANDPAQDADHAAAMQALKDEGLDFDDDLWAQIKASKGNTVKLSMSELAGKSKEEKLAILEKKRAQFRDEQAKMKVMDNLDRERQRREAVKAQADLKRQREEHQLRMMAQKKKREKEFEKERKKRIREKIKADKERKQREKEITEKLKQQNIQPPP